MSIWQHAEFEAEATDAARLAKLRLHIAEVEAAITADVGQGSTTRSSAPLEQKLIRLGQRRDQLEGRVLQPGRRPRAHIATAGRRVDRY